MATQLENQSELLTREPKKFAVFMLNDDYTTWEFCVRIITTVFHKNVQEADAITHDIHTTGKGLCGIYNYESLRPKLPLCSSRRAKRGFLCAVL